MDTTELQNLLTFTRQIIHTGKGDPLHGARCLIACVKNSLVTTPSSSIPNSDETAMVSL